MALREIVGQDRALRILLGTLKRNRVPSSILLSGDVGIGKRLSAINYAKAINCLEPVDFDCCDKCTSCRKIDASVHPDVLVITLENVETVLGLRPKEGKDKNRYEYPIETIHKIEEFLYLSPYEGKKKIVIIDEADAMNVSAANAFLKTLEEPNDDSIIILISSNPDRLPDTIRSRCIIIRFYPIPLEYCKELVTKWVDSKYIDYITRLVMGRPGLAVSKDLIKEFDWFKDLLKHMLDGGSKDLWSDRSEMRVWFDMAAVFLRDLVVFKVTQRESDLIFGGSEHRSSKEEIKNIIDSYCEIERISGLLNFNLNKSITWNYVASIMKKAMGNG